MTRKCPKCGKENDDVASFCANCGFSFNSDFNHNEVEPSKPSNNLSISIERNGSKSTIRLPSLKAILAILALLIILVLLISNQMGHVKDVQTATHNDADVNKITLIKENIKGYAYMSDGVPHCSYYVEGVLKNLPDKIEGYSLVGTFYDENGKYIGEDDAMMRFVKEDSDKSEPDTIVVCYTNGVKNLSYVELEMTDPDGKVVFNQTLNYDMERMDLSKVEGYY